MKMNFSRMIKNLGKWAIKHQPEIMHAMGFAAGASALVLTATGTVKATKAIEVSNAETKAEKVKVGAKYYIPAATAAVTSVVFHTIGIKTYIHRNAMLASWGTMMYDKLNKLEEKNVQVLGEKKSEKIKEELALDELRKTSITNVKETGYGSTLFVDGLTHQVFRSDYSHIMNSINELNSGIANAIAYERGDHRRDGGHYPSLWDYERALNLDETNFANHYGWYDGKLIYVHIYYEKAENGEPIGYIDHKTLYGPRPDSYYINH